MNDVAHNVPLMISGNRKVNVWMILGGVLAAFLVWSTDGTAEQRSSSSQQLIGIARTGLDAQNNKIDALIATFGYVCSRTLTDRPCSIERELLSMIRNLTRDRETIRVELRRLGATCDDDAERLQCSYEPVVETAGWIFGNTTPSSITKDFFQIDFVMEGKEESLKYQVTFRRNGRE